MQVRLRLLIRRWLVLSSTLCTKPKLVARNPLIEQILNRRLISVVWYDGERQPAQCWCLVTLLEEVFSILVTKSD